MTPLGSRATTSGLTVMMFSVSAGMHFDGFGLLLCYMGVLVGASLVVAGVRMADGPAPNPIVPVVCGGARALAAFVRRNAAAVGLVMASCAFTAVSGEEDPAVCFGMFLLLLLGLTLVNIGAHAGILNWQRYPEAPELTLTGNQLVTAAAAAAAAVAVAVAATAPS